MAARGGAGGMALGGWGLVARPSRWGGRAGGGRTGERRRQALVGAAQRVPTAAPGLEADLEGERSAVPRPWSPPSSAGLVGPDRDEGCDGDARSASSASELVAWDDEREARSGMRHVV